MRVVFLGPPGAGKGTQAKRLLTYLQNPPHISTGEMLREAIRQGSELGRTAAKAIHKGRLVSDDLVLNLVRERLDQPDCRQGWMFDGFPRTLRQAEALDQLLEDRGKPLDCVLLITVENDELVRRLTKRAKREGRADDTEDVVKQRLEVYQTQTSPLVDYYRDRGLLDEVDGLGSPDDVFHQIRQHIDRRRALAAARP